MWSLKWKSWNYWDLFDRWILWNDIRKVVGYLSETEERNRILFISQQRLFPDHWYTDWSLIQHRRKQKKKERKRERERKRKCCIHVCKHRNLISKRTVQWYCNYSTRLSVESKVLIKSSIKRNAVSAKWNSIRILFKYSS